MVRVGAKNGEAQHKDDGTWSGSSQMGKVARESMNGQEECVSGREGMPQAEQGSVRVCESMWVDSVAWHKCRRAEGKWRRFT